MKKSLFRAAPACVAATALLLPSAAAAATISIDDAAGDTWQMTQDEQTGAETYHPAGTQLNVDLTRTVVKHTSGKLVLKATYETLRGAQNRYYFAARVRTDEGLKREVGVETFTRQGWRGASFMTKASGREVRCSGMTHDVDYAADTVRLTVPRACLGKPRWVQVAVGAFAVAEGSADFTLYVDNGHDESADDPLTWSAKVRRG